MGILAFSIWHSSEYKHQKQTFWKCIFVALKVKCVFRSIVPFCNFDFNFFSLPAAQLSAYKYTTDAKQKPLCSLIVDSGFSFSHVVPVCDGKLVNKAIKRWLIFVNLGASYTILYIPFEASWFLYRIGVGICIMPDLSDTKPSENLAYPIWRSRQL